MLRRLPLARFLPGGNGPIRIEGRTLLGPKEYLCLVRVGTRTILIGVSAGRIVPLDAWPEAEVATGGVPAPTAWVGRGQADEPEGNPHLPTQLRSLRARLGGQSR
ncbi:MAG: flagellar biosynthetic protein FliO [Candidatus Rokubacteria bacterium]|nr:flagellar biosynthetic protein FliO [Candidatus Rokubacteria bacterium]